MAPLPETVGDRMTTVPPPPSSVPPAASVRVEDHRIGDPAAFDSVLIRMNANATGDFEDLYLTETGKDSGVFEGTVATGWGPTPGDGLLTIPFTAALLIATSESMVGPKLAAARDGALAFVDGMRDLDQATVITFADTIRGVTPFTNDREILAAGLVGNRGEGGTAVHDAVYVALKRLELQQGRRVLVLLSDGIDSHSGLSGGDLLDHVRTSRAMVYWIRLADGNDDAAEYGRHGKHFLPHVLKALFGNPGFCNFRARTALFKHLTQFFQGPGAQRHLNPFFHQPHEIKDR